MAPARARDRRAACGPEWPSRVCLWHVLLRPVKAWPPALALALIPYAPGETKDLARRHSALALLRRIPRPGRREDQKPLLPLPPPLASTVPLCACMPPVTGANSGGHLRSVLLFLSMCRGNRFPACGPRPIAIPRRARHHRNEHRRAISSHLLLSGQTSHIASSPSTPANLRRACSVCVWMVGISAHEAKV